MKVSELMEKLKEMPQDCKVMVYDEVYENEIYNIKTIFQEEEPLCVYLEIENVYVPRP